MNELSQREIVKLNRWYEEIKAQRASGLTVMEWCTQQGKSEAGFYYRRRRVQSVLESMLTPREEPGFPLEFAALPSGVVKPEVLVQQAEPFLHIRQNNLEIDIPTNASPETIQAVIGALKC